ncbi:pannexin-1-like [Sardina pilchardus]|uniref:pannexin-1-like n=1 Tax=Sardina pilchardus TaxID=27697 RepID=UPI002E15B19E
MAIAHVATEYVFSDFLLKEPNESKYKGVRLELAVDKLVTFIAVGLPLLLISLAFAQEVSVGTQISCFAPTNFSWRQAYYVDSYCWAAVQDHQPEDGPNSAPLWLHKFFPYILLLVAILMYVPAVFWRFTAAPHLSSDLSFIMEELDRAYNRAIRLAKNLASSLEAKESSEEDAYGALDLAEGCFKYPLVEQYLKTKRFCRTLVLKYVLCRALTLVTLLLACFYLGYYIRLASAERSDEFACDIRTGVLRHHRDAGETETTPTPLPAAVQCKLVAVGVFRLLSYINLVVYVLLVPVVAYAAVAPARQGALFLRPYEMLPAFGSLDLATSFYDDLSLYLLFLEENLSELKSYKCLQVLELLREGGGEAFDTMCLLRTLGQVKTDVVDVVDGKRPSASKSHKSEAGNNTQEVKDAAPLLKEDAEKKEAACACSRDVRQRLV